MARNDSKNFFGSEEVVKILLEAAKDGSDEVPISIFRNFIPLISAVESTGCIFSGQSYHE